MVDEVFKTLGETVRNDVAPLLKREPGDGFKALGTATKELGGGLWTAVKNTFGGTKSVTGGVARTTFGLADRTAGVVSWTTKPINWLIRRPFLGPVAIVGAAALGGKAVMDYYSEKRDAVNTLGYDPSVGPIPAPAYPTHMNVTTPEDYASLQSRMKDSAVSQDSAQFAQAEAAKREQAGTPVVAKL